MRIFKMMAILSVFFTFAVAEIASAQDAQAEYQKQLEEWEKKKEEIEKKNAAKKAAAGEGALENEMKRAYNDGNIALRKGRYSEAIAAYDEALSIDSTYAVAHYGRGLALKKSRRTTDALEAFKACVRHDPTYAKGFFALGNAYADIDRHKDAIAAYERAVLNDPTDSRSYYQMGASYLSLNQPPKAVEALQKAVEADPKYSQAYYTMGVAQVAQGSLSDAVASFSKSAEVKPSEATYYKLAETYNKLNRHSDALEAADKGLQEKADYAPAAFEAGLALKSMGRYNDAVSKFRIAAKNVKWKESAQYQIDDIDRLKKQGS